MSFADFSISGRTISTSSSPFVIAELSGNHDQSLEKARSMVKAAAEAGADAIKLQTYTANTMTLDAQQDEFYIKDNDNLWKGQSLHQLYQKASTPWSWHQELFDYANSLGVIAFSSPFDISAVDFLESLDVPCYKIASFENTDIPLIKRIARTGKPVIMSTGMAELHELAESVQVLKDNGCTQLALLKCTSAYPAPASEANLATMVHMRQTFQCEVGLSDHSPGVTAAIGATVLGASIIEKHFVLNRADGGVDADFSLEPDELKELVQHVEIAAQLKGQITFGGSASEQESKKYRRSIYISRDVIAGEPVTEENIQVVRPGLGLAPKYYEDVIGRTFSTSCLKGTALDWTLLS